MAETQQVAVVLEKPGQIKMLNRPVPEIQDPHYVKVQIKATGICGSDIHFFTHGAIGDFILKAPMILGHESSGVVVEIGNAVTLVKPGDRVAIEPGVASRYSEETLSGHYNLCPHMAFAATPPHDGTLVKYFLSPEDLVYKLPDRVSFEEGALVEPLSVGVHANRLAATTFGKRVLVFGAGPVGLLTGAVARAFGAVDVVYIDIFDDKLERAKQFGATHTILWKSNAKEPEAGLVNEITRVLQGEHTDIVFECSGVENCIRGAIKACRRGGTIIQIGMGKDNVSFPVNDISTKEITYQGCFRYFGGDYKAAVKLISTGKVNVKPLITQRFSFDQAVEAYQYNVEHSAEICKTMISGPQ